MVCPKLEKKASSAERMKKRRVSKERKMSELKWKKENYLRRRKAMPSEQLKKEWEKYPIWKANSRKRKLWAETKG